MFRFRKTIVLGVLATAGLAGAAYAGAADQALSLDPSITQSDQVPNAADRWIASLDDLNAPLLASDAGTPATQPAPSKGLPLPVHTVEGVGGGAITPTAYLVNPGPKGELFGLPSASITGVWLGHGQNLESVAITETILDHVELGYALERFGIGDTQNEIKTATGINVPDDVYVNNFNARLLVLDENSFNTDFLPAFTIGTQYKVNNGIQKINNDLGGALSGIGLEHADGWDFTLTASKTFANVFGRPLIVSAGARNSDAAWMGFLGFGGQRYWTFEGNVIYVPTDWLALGYEYRGKHDPYSQIHGLVGGEDAIQAFSAIFMPSPHFNIALVYGIFGNVLNHEDNNSLAIQFKWEF